MYHQNSCLDAIETVLAWELSDETFPEAFNVLSLLLAGVNPEEVFDLD